MFRAERSTLHRDDDDLLTAGLGLEGLRRPIPPVFADAAAPTASELRRRAIWANWRGIADLAAGGGYGVLYGSTTAVPGREFSALATLPGARHPHRVLAQVPDGFDRERRCLVVSASSGSRGVYGAIAVAGAWGLPKGCAVAYTDKGAGTDYYDLDIGVGARADGTLGDVVHDRNDMAFVPAVGGGATGVAYKHGHSQDNPEADWGRHVRQAAEFGLLALAEAFPEEAPFTFANTRVIAVGISNGASAVLRAAESSDDWLDAVVAGAPNIYVAGARPLYDYATEAALLMPCALLHMQHLSQPPLAVMSRPVWTQQCAELRKLGLIDGDTVKAQAHDAYTRMRASGWSDAALRAGALSVDFDLWRAIAVTYASSYGRYAVGEHPCGYWFTAQNDDFSSRAATAQERAAWWSDASGIPPGAGIAIARPVTTDPEPAGLQCLRRLWIAEKAPHAQRVRGGIAQTRAAPPRQGLPVIVLHGSDDGLVPTAFSSEPYVAMAREAKRDVRYWQVGNVQHFDVFLGLPDYGARYLPLLPYVYRALDLSLAHLEHGADMPKDAVIDTMPRAGKPLASQHLRMP